MTVFASRWLPAFDDTFWISFWPEAAAGIVTGLAVGIVILLAESRAERRSDIRSSKLGWSSVRGGVERSILLSGAFSATNISTSGFGRTEIEELLRGRPLDTWIEDLHLAELVALKRFMEAGDRFDNSAKSFRLTCSPAVASATGDLAKRDQITKRLHLMARHARTEVIEAFLGGQSQDVIEAATIIMTRDEVKAAHHRHRDALTELTTSRNVLISALGLVAPSVPPLVFIDPIQSSPARRTRAVRYPSIGAGSKARRRGDGLRSARR